MRCVFKYPLTAFSADGVVSLTLPAGAQVLHVDAQGGVPTLWALVDPLEHTIPRRFRIAETGEHIGDETGIYIGTILLEAGNYVVHVFGLDERVRPGASW